MEEGEAEEEEIVVEEIMSQHRSPLLGKVALAEVGTQCARNLQG